MTKSKNPPTVEWFRSLAAITDALIALENQCVATGFVTVANKLRSAKAEIAAAAEIIQSQAYNELEAEISSEDGSDTTKH